MKRLLLYAILSISLTSHAQIWGSGAIASSQLESTAAQRYIDAAVITDATQISAVKQLVADLSGVTNVNYSTSNTFHKFNIIYPFLGGTSTTCSYNLKDPTTFQFTVVNGATPPTFSSAGYVGSTTSYIRTGMTPSTSMTTNDRHISIRAASSVGQATAASDISAVDGSARSMRIRVRAGSDTYDATNGPTGTTVSTTNASTSTVYATNSRTSSTSFVFYKDGSSIGSSVTTNSTTPPTVEMPIGASNSSGTFTAIGVSRTYNFFTAGKGLTATEVANLHSAQNFFNTTTLSR